MDCEKIISERRSKVSCPEGAVNSISLKKRINIQIYVEHPCKEF